MKIELTTEQEIADYMHYLYEKESLVSKLGCLSLEGGDAETYFLHTINAKKRAEPPKPQLELPKMQVELTKELSATPKKAKVSRDKRKWSSSEDNKLLALIKANQHPSDIAIGMGREESGVRCRANRKFHKGYKKKTWWDMPQED